MPITKQLPPRSVEWRPCDSVRIVNWCGHAEERDQHRVHIGLIEAGPTEAVLGQEGVEAS
jgi:hypothetical protein